MVTRKGSLKPIDVPIDILTDVAAQIDAAIPLLIPWVSELPDGIYFTLETSYLIVKGAVNH
jgi:hypothetical protein